jgi:pimeloyl-ACP methyl ester carboxylesterase
MKNFRTWGQAPYKAAVIHGGPGAPGSLAPVAREMSEYLGVIEPLQTADSSEGQLAELAAVLQEHAALPVTLVGWSWGAILSYIAAARFPALVKKLVLIGTPPLDFANTPDLAQVWLDRLPEEKRIEYLSLENIVWGGAAGDKSASMARLFRLIAKAESYDPVPYKDEVLEYQVDINISVGLELRQLLASGELLKLGKKIACPVLAIHGDYDPRPARCVEQPLSRVIRDFKFVLLGKCGHYPWMEKYARENFLKVLRKEIA